MTNKKTKIILSLVLIIWVWVIFYFSSQPPSVSYDQSKLAIKVITKINEMFDISNTLFYQKVSNFIKNSWYFGFGRSTNIVVRKSAHMGIYFLLGVISAAFGYVYSRKKLMGFLMGISLPVTVAVLDEFNQGLVGRSSSLDDVIIDGAGAFAGSVVVTIAVFIYGILRLLIGSTNKRT